jgi:hypothetical protein
MKLALALLVAATPAAAQELVAYDCDFGSRIEVVELPRDTLVLWLDEEPAVAMTALPSAGYGRLYGTDGSDWRMFEDGTAERTSYPAEGADGIVERCALAE